jgi:hypothetical protein
MREFLSEADFLPNMNVATIAGKVIRVEPLTGKTPGLAFVVGYVKHWPNGAAQEIPLRCYLTGAERIDRAGWLKVGEVVLVHGEVTDKGAIYAYQLDHLSKPPRQAGEGDQFLAGMQALEASQQ